MSGVSRRDRRAGDDVFGLPTAPVSQAQQIEAPAPSPELRIYQPPSRPRLPRTAPRVGEDLARPAEQARELRDVCVELARRAKNAFIDACSSAGPDEAETSFISAKSLLEELWDYAYLRDRPFRDLLALLDAALKRAELGEFDESQRDVLRQAFADLPRWLLDDAILASHIERFAEHNVDITSPLRAASGKKVRVTIEVIEE